MFKIVAGVLGFLIGYLDHIAIMRMSKALIVRGSRFPLFLGSIARFLAIGILGFLIFKLDPVGGIIFLTAFTLSLIGISTCKALRGGKEGERDWRK